MPDVTRCAPTSHPQSRHVYETASRGSRPAPAGPPGSARVADSDDILAAVLIRMWSLASGRTLRTDVRPDQLTEEELLGFWADDMATAAGRHAITRGEAE